MKYKSCSFLFFLVFSCRAFAMELEKNSNNSQSSTSVRENFSDLELGSISDYDSDTIQAANEGFIHWEEREYDKAEEPLKRAAENRYFYSMPKYALLLLDEEHLLKSKTIKEDIYQVADLMLMAAMRQEEMAINYIQDLDKTARKITIEKDEDSQEKTTSKGLIETIKLASKNDIKKWLKGELGSDSKKYPQPIQDALKLFYLCVLSTLDEEFFTKLTSTTAKEIRSISSEKNQALGGRNAVDIHGYASKTLKLEEKISETPSTYLRQSQSQLKGDHNYAYYNTRNKYPYDLDVCLRTLNCSLNKKLWEDKNERFVQTQVEPMSAGPVYDSLRDWQPNKNTPKVLTDATTFVIDSFYREFSEIFYGHPLWLIEMTHMDTPWENIAKLIKLKHDGKWPKTEGKWTKDSEEGKKREALKKKYQEEIEAYTKTIDAKKSISYRLFLIALKDQMNKALIISENEVKIDLRYISKDRLAKYKKEISETQTLVLNNGVSRKKEWISDLIETAQWKSIQYTLDERCEKTAKFEKYLCKLRKDKEITIERKDGPTPPKAEEKKKVTQRKEVEDTSSQGQKEEKRKEPKTEVSPKESQDKQEDVVIVEKKKRKKDKIEESQGETSKKIPFDASPKKKKTKKEDSSSDLDPRTSNIEASKKDHKEKRKKSKRSSKESVGEETETLKTKKKKQKTTITEDLETPKDKNEKSKMDSSKETEDTQKLKKKLPKKKNSSLDIQQEKKSSKEEISE